MQLFQVTEQQYPVTEHVNTARNTLRKFVNDCVRLLGEIRVTLPADLFQPGFDIIFAFIRSQSTKVIIDNDTLTQLLQVRLFQHLTKLGLPQQESL